MLRVLARFALVAAVTTGLGTLITAPASADPSASTWAKLRQCESSGNYGVVASSGHYGAYQFDLSTWRSVGGTGMPNQASRLEQDYRALYLYRTRGWQPWECGRILGLQDDADGGSGRVPSYADARYISGQPAPGPAPAPTPPSSGGVPKWDGLVYFKNDCSSAIRTFQLRMNQIGSKYHFQGSGCYYQHTYDAVVALQKANGIRPSGRLGPKTWLAAWKGKHIG